MSKIYDCFCYFNEDMILELRLETLWNHVDYFVISEANYTHSGNPRTLRFDINKFSKYQSKIRYLPLTQKPPGKHDDWKNENFIRNNIINGLYDASPDDWILVSDLDEIPRPEKIKEYNPTRLRGDFRQKFYGFFLNNLWLGDCDSNEKLKSNRNQWHGSKITTHKKFIDFFMGDASNFRLYSYEPSGRFQSIKKLWFKHFFRQIIHNGGWHFSWIFDIAEIIEKIESTAHQEFNTEYYKNPERIQRLIMQGRDFHKPQSRYKAQKLDKKQFPHYLVEHAEKYNTFLIPTD